MHKARIFSFVTALCLFSWTAAQGQITPLGDAYTNTADSTTNYGAATLLYVNGATEIAYIQFPLSSIPAGASISQATLKLYVNTVPTAGSFNVDYVNGAWAESTIDSSNAPPLGSTIASDVSITTTDKNQYILINVTSAVQAWLDGSQANDGIALVANSTFEATFDSKENTTTSHPAELDIAYAGGSGTITGVTTASGSGLTGGGTSGTLNLSLTSACATNQVLQWNGSSWACASAGTGTITGVTAGTDLTGGGTSGNVTLNLNTSSLNSTYAQLAAANTFTGNQTVDGNLSATGVVTGSSFEIGSNLFAYGSYTNENAYLGFSGNGTTTGGGDTALGYQAFLNNTSGADNTAIGYQALINNTSGLVNTAVGDQALENNTTGQNNTAIGELAGTTADSSAMTASNNSFLGANTTVSTGTISNATAVGSGVEVAESNALVLGSGANVGIGTSTPAAPLHINGPAAAPPGSLPSSNNGLLLGSNGTSSYKWIQTYGGNLTLNPVGNDVGIGTESPDMLLSVNGNADKSGGGSWATFSDRRLKDLNGSFSSGLEQVLKINPVRYRYKDANGMGISDRDEHVGLVAQEVQKVIPEAVTENNKGYLLVNNDPIIWAMLNAIKEQQKEIQRLSSQLHQTRQALRQVKAQVAKSRETLVAVK